MLKNNFMTIVDSVRNQQEERHRTCKVKKTLRRCSSWKRRDSSPSKKETSRNSCRFSGPNWSALKSKAKVGESG